MDEIKVFAKNPLQQTLLHFPKPASQRHILSFRDAAPSRRGGRPKNSAEEGDVVVVSSAERYWGRGEGRQKNFWEGLVGL